MTLEQFNERWTPEPFSGCWIWIGNGGSGGYGRFNLLPTIEERSHRVAWKLYRGEIPKGLFVLHKCDVRECVNPDHLFLGTKRDNTRDAIAKGRFKINYPKGQINGKAKFTETQVIEIRKSKTPGRVLARQLGVSHTCIQLIRNRKNWSHVA